MLNIVFLDIDGVLQPYNSDLRFNYIRDKNIINDLSNKFNTDYSIYDKYDVLATLYDWNKKAIKRLNYILETTNSKIIISSDWRQDKYPNKMKDLLKIHNLDQYYFTDNIIIKDFIYYPKRRALEIENSLNNYNINNFVILDDMKGLEQYYKENTVITHNYISNTNMTDSIKILKK